MKTSSRKRRVLLLLCGFLFLSVVLISLGIRLVRQETELSTRQLEDERRDAADQLRREMSARLETIRLQELNRLKTTPEYWATRSGPESEVVFAAVLDGDRLRLPWETRSPIMAFSRRFSDYRKVGETLEFRERAFLSALNAYRYGFAAASNPTEKCNAELWIGRVLMKADRKAEATDTFRSMLEHCGSARDEEGMPLHLYAAERLITEGLDPQRGLSHVQDTSTKSTWRSPLESYLLRSLLVRAAGTESETAVRNLTAEIQLSERMVVLANEFVRLGRPELSLHARSGAVWLAFGDVPWLITITPAEGQPTATVLAIAADKTVPPGVRFLAADSGGGFPVGEEFPGLRAEWEPNRFTEKRVPRGLYAVGIVLILAGIALGGYLLIRDVDREVQVAEMRSLFVASVSHELKTPLTAIRMFAETLVDERTSDPAANAKYQRTILNESERLSRLVDNVLDFARIEKAQKIYQMRPVCLANIVRSAVQVFQYPLARQNFSLNVAIEEDVPAVFADSDAVEQALLNLLANAMKYSGDDRRIDLRLRRAGVEAVLEVEDHGIGIAKEEQSRIFDKFYRVRSAETDRVPGAGIGLTLVSHFVKAHGGRISVSSAPGAGSLFSIHFPLMKEQPSL